jgi:putative ABC transport system substrate-binding protein
MSYGYSLRGTVRSAADIVDKILRGAKASEIPIQQSTTFQFVINLKTAKMLGFAIPPSLLARADQIIE